MQFHEKRRQQFLSERQYLAELTRLPSSIAYFAAHPVGSGATALHRDMLARLTSAEECFDHLALRYTAGDPIEPLRSDLEKVIAAYERYADLLWQYTADRNEPTFAFDVLDDYCQLMQLVGLCFLLHRRDLLPRIAAMQDGVDAIGQTGQGMGGADWVFEEFMSLAIGPENRYESETIHWDKPYEALADALSSVDNDAALGDLDRFLKRWYKDLSGTAWHDSHKPNENGDQGGYHGYWSFEAGAAVLLLGIEDDSSLHKYLYYPKDLVTWAREHAVLSADPSSNVEHVRLRCEAGQPCPRDGEWETPALANSRRSFKQGEVMPSVEGDYGQTIWQWVGESDV
ncbi:MAG: DUF1911 domain-containing protein [Aquabacterium sp.]|nr:MAG: DUF1911 domain-containing protein [Aquabacterium sp.]